MTYTPNTPKWDEEPRISIPNGTPAPADLLSANPDLNSSDMRELLMEYGVGHKTATELTQDRREAEWRANGQA